MNIEKMKKERLLALKHAYDQLIIALNQPLPKNKAGKIEVDPEKMKNALLAYEAASDVSDKILKQMMELMEEDGTLVKKKKVSKALSPESR